MPFCIVPILVAASALQKVAPVKGVDMEVEGTINGVGVYSFDVDAVIDKPWRKPGKLSFYSQVFTFWGF